MEWRQTLTNSLSTRSRKGNPLHKGQSMLPTQLIKARQAPEAWRHPSFTHSSANPAGQLSRLPPGKTIVPVVTLQLDPLLFAHIVRNLFVDLSSILNPAKKHLMIQLNIPFHLRHNRDGRQAMQVVPFFTPPWVRIAAPVHHR